MFLAELESTGRGINAFTSLPALSFKFTVSDSFIFSFYCESEVESHIGAVNRGSEL